MAFRFSELTHIRYTEGSRGLSFVMGSKFYSMNVPPNFPMETDADSVLRALDNMLAEVDKVMCLLERQNADMSDAMSESIDKLQDAMPS